MSLSCGLLFAVFVDFLDFQFQSTFSQKNIEQNGNPMLPPPPPSPKHMVEIIMLQK